MAGMDGQCNRFGGGRIAQQHHLSRSRRTHSIALRRCCGNFHQHQPDRHRHHFSTAARSAMPSAAFVRPPIGLNYSSGVAIDITPPHWLPGAGASRARYRVIELHRPGADDRRSGIKFLALPAHNFLPSRAASCSLSGICAMLVIGRNHRANTNSAVPRDRASLLPCLATL